MSNWHQQPPLVYSVCAGVGQRKTGWAELQMYISMGDAQTRCDLHRSTSTCISWLSVSATRDACMRCS